MRADTIFAPATAAGRAAVAIVRISGPSTSQVLLSLTGRTKLPRERRASLETFRHGSDQLDHGLVLWFPGPNSVSGEDLAELHLHGGHAVTRRVLAALSSFEGLRLAEPGEFTRRGFLAGKIDLIQAEAIADLIDAETEHQAVLALTQLGGGLSRLYEAWRERIVRGLAFAEAVLDFPDEEVPDQAAAAIAPDLRSVSEEIGKHLADGNRGEILRDGLSVVILGAPNAGKSSLLNAMAKREVAIVSEIAGTTRDVLEVRLNIQGYPIVLSDTAGIRETQEPIEGEGIRRAKEAAGRAQVRVLVVDSLSVTDLDSLTALLSPGDLIVWSKSDTEWTPPDTSFESLRLSVVSGEGLDVLIRWLGHAATKVAGRPGELFLTRARHRQALEQARDALEQGLKALDNSLDLATEDFRMAARSIGRITGRVDVEDVLDVVFREFCIGK